VGRLGSGPRIVGRIGSGVRVNVSFQQNTRRVLSYDVLRQQKTELCVRGVDLRLRRITSSPSQTLRRRIVRTTATDAAVSARLDAVRRVFIFHTSRLVRFTAIFVQNLVFCLPHLHSTPQLGGFPSEYRHPVWQEKTRMAWLPDGENISKISLFVLTKLTNVTDGQTHRHRMTA